MSKGKRFKTKETKVKKREKKNERKINQKIVDKRKVNERINNNNYNYNNTSRNVNPARPINKRKREKRLGNFVLTLLQLFFICMMIYSGSHIYIWWKDNQSSQQQLDKIANSVSTTNGITKIDFAELKKINPETVGWIRVPNTKIDFPVVQTKNNDYYLYHSFDKSENSAGWIFMNSKNSSDLSDRNTVIFGHNRRNDSMFGTLKNILKEGWYSNQKNRTITYINEEGEKTYKIVSIYSVPNEDYYITTDFSDTDYEKFINEIKIRSVKNFEENVTLEDKILTLSTCANDSNYRVVLHAKLVK